MECLIVKRGLTALTRTSDVLVNESVVKAVIYFRKVVEKSENAYKFMWLRGRKIQLNSPVAHLLKISGLHQKHII